MTKQVANPAPPSQRGQGAKTNEFKGLEKKEIYSIRFYPSLRKRIEDRAKEEGITVNELIERYINAGLG